jgi:hypothetical protein
MKWIPKIIVLSFVAALLFAIPAYFSNLNRGTENSIYQDKWICFFEPFIEVFLPMTLAGIGCYLRTHMEMVQKKYFLKSLD